MRTRPHISGTTSITTFELCQIVGMTQKFIDDVILTVMGLACNLQARHKKGLEEISEVLHVLQHSNFFRLIDMEKLFHRERRYKCDVVWVQFTDQTQNENQI